MVLTGQVQRDLVGLVNAHGPLAVGISGEDAHLFAAEQRTVMSDGQELDLGLVGDVTAVRPDFVASLLDDGFIPVISTIGVAEASGLGSFLDAQPQFRALGEDGCIPPAVPVVETFPVVRHVVTAWLRQALGLDAVPVGLGPDVADAYPVAVEIESTS